MRVIEVKPGRVRRKLLEAPRRFKAGKDILMSYEVVSVFLAAARLVVLLVP
jgi:hypothetical protein